MRSPGDDFKNRRDMRGWDNHVLGLNDPDLMYILLHYHFLVVCYLWPLDVSVRILGTDLASIFLINLRALPSRSGELSPWHLSD